MKVRVCAYSFSDLDFVFSWGGQVVVRIVPVPRNSGMACRVTWQIVCLYVYQPLVHYWLGLNLELVISMSCTLSNIIHNITVAMSYYRSTRL